jgi:sugar lactone lactonase YvrE
VIDTKWLLVTCVIAQVPVYSQNYIITTVAGANRVTEGSPATSEPLRTPASVALDSGGNLYVADGLDNRIRRITSSGTISTFAGTGAPGFTGDRGKAVQATLNIPAAVAVDSSGNVYIADSGNNCVRKITTDGIINTVVGTGARGSGGDGGPAIKAQVEPTAVAVDSAGNLYVGDAVTRIRKVDAVSGIITTIAGTGILGFSGDNGPAAMAQINLVAGIAVGPDGTVYFADSNNYVVRRIDTGGVIKSVAGTGNPFGYVYEGAPALQYLMVPSSVILDGTSLYVTDVNQAKLLRIDLVMNAVFTVAGNGNSGFSGDNGPPTQA